MTNTRVSNYFTPRTADGRTVFLAPDSDADTRYPFTGTVSELLALVRSLTIGHVWNDDYSRFDPAPIASIDLFHGNGLYWDVVGTDDTDTDDYSGEAWAQAFANTTYLGRTR